MLKPIDILVKSRYFDLMNSRAICLIFAVFFCLQLSGQMTLHPGNIEPLTPDNIIQNVFLGNGVDLIETSYSGFSASIGLFDNAEDQIGLNKGIVLSTGYAANVIKKNSFDNPLSSNTTGTTYKDTDLEALAGSEVVDIVKFDITFIPSSDLISFRYVFASEEYPDFVCADKNDAFGFFISGKKPGGGEYIAHNIAAIPDPNNPEAFLDLPVSINSVNGGQVGIFGNSSCDGPKESLDFSQYYNEVPNGQAPALNGYLDVFVAQAAVIPCETYTIKIVLGDGNDQNEDSVVFLEERSFSTGTLTIDINNPGINGGLAEGCDAGSLRLHLPDTVKSDFPLEVEILSSSDLVNAAIPDIDFIDLPNNLFIPAGASFIDLDLQPIDDNLDEGTEYIYIKIKKSICTVDTIILPLYNNNLEQVQLPDTVFACIDEAFELEADLGSNINASSLLTFNNNAAVKISKTNKHTESTINVFGLKDIALNPSIISEICIDSLEHPRLNDLDIYLRAPSNQVIELSTDNGSRLNNDDQLDYFIHTCFSINSNSSINLGNPSESNMDLANPTYTGTYLPEGDFDEWLSPITSKLNGGFTLFIVDDKQEFEGELFSWHISFNPKYELDYTWAPNDDIECADCEIATGIGSESKYYYMHLEDSYGCTITDSVWVQISAQSETPTVTCEASRAGALQFTWNETKDSEFYEFEINGNGKWYSTAEILTFESSLIEINILSPTVIEVTGLLANEEITVAVRGNNAANCVSQTATSTCTSIDCTSMQPRIDSIIIDQPACSNQLTTRVDVFATSLALPLTYRVDVLTATASNQLGTFYKIPQGTWSIRIIDNNGCAIETVITVNKPETIIFNEEVKEITCHDDNDASIVLNPSGDFPPFEMLWNDGNTSDTRTNLKANFYTVSITDSQGCMESMDFHIKNPLALVADYIQSEILNCSGTNPAYAYLEISGGTAPYKTTWNSNVIQDTLFNLELGPLSYTLSDSRGCLINETITVLHEDGLRIDFENIVDATCADSNDGTATIIISNGTGPYLYEWANGETSAIVNNLLQGSNAVTVTDFQGCTAMSTVEILAPQAIKINYQAVAPSCTDTQDGKLSIQLEGGSGSYSLLWANGKDSYELSDLAAGSYCLTITDSAGCKLDTCLVVASINSLSVTENITKVACDNISKGAIEITPDGGSGDYLYKWNGPDNFKSDQQNIYDLEIGTYTLLLTDKNNQVCTLPINIELTAESEISAMIRTVDFIKCYGDNEGALEVITTDGILPYSYTWSNNETSKVITGLEAGSYQVTITDANNCSATTEMKMEQPRLLVSDTRKKDIDCYRDTNGTISVIVEGGTIPYFYQWNNNAVTASINNLPPGNYILTVTDANGCSLVVYEDIFQPERPIDLAVNIQDVTCSEGSNGIVTAASDFGTSPYRYRIGNGDFIQDSQFNNLSAGYYTIQVIDSNGCSNSLEIEVNEAEPIEVNFMNELTVAYGDSLQLEIEISNTQGQQSYFWDAPDIENFSCIDCPNPMIYDVTSSFSGSLMVIDSQECESEIFFNVNVLEDGKLAVPTGFSPNGDSVNDVLYVHGDPELIINRFEIYTRWGELVFQASQFHPSDITSGWNGKHAGKDLPQDSYIWVLECEMRSGNIEILKGQTTLIK